MDTLNLFLLGVLGGAMMIAMFSSKSKKKVRKIVDDKFVNNLEKLSEKMIKDREEDKKFNEQLLKTLVEIEKSLNDTK